MDSKIIKYLLVILFSCSKSIAVEFYGSFIQGSFIVGKTNPDDKIKIETDHYKYIDKEKEIDSEIIVVRNSISAADAFSKGSQKAYSYWLLFVHQDVHFPAGADFH